MPRSTPATLLQMLAQRVELTPGRTAFHFQERAYRFDELWAGCRSFAACLRERKVSPGDRVLMVLPNGMDFFVAFYGVQMAGGIPVPLYPESGASRIERIARSAGANVVVVAGDAALEDLPGGLTLCHTDATPAATGEPEFPEVRGEDIAMLQYTSGSTGEPKGVMLTHANLLANIEQLIAGMRITENDVVVSWLPLCHDMGLILMSMVPFYLGAGLVLLPAQLTNMQAWLRTIESHRGTLTAAPDFAYRFMLRYLKDPARFDLSSLRVALNAAEPVRAPTMQAFAETFQLPGVMISGYGLAEASCGVSTAVPGEAPRVDERGNICAGPPFPGMRVKIDSGDSGDSGDADELAAGPGQVGEILVSGPSVTTGYYANAEASAALFDAEGYARTGDLGYLDAEGRIYVVGRLKDVMVQAGQTVAGREVEEVVDALDFVRLSVAIGIDKGGFEGEQIHIFAEIRRGAGDYEDMAADITHAFHEYFGFRPGKVLLLDRHGIARTPNGKLQRGALRRAYSDGGLRAAGKILYPDW